MRWLNNKEIETLYNNKEKLRHYCPNCGHTVTVCKDKKICNHCRNYVFKDERTQFEYRLKENLLKEKRKLKYE